MEDPVVERMKLDLDERMQAKLEEKGAVTTQTVAPDGKSGTITITQPLGGVAIVGHNTAQATLNEMLSKRGLPADAVVLKEQQAPVGQLPTINQEEDIVDEIPEGFVKLGYRLFPKESVVSSTATNRKQRRFVSKKTRKAKKAQRVRK